jgi:hypothetical protein
VHSLGLWGELLVGYTGTKYTMPCPSFFILFYFYFPYGSDELHFVTFLMDTFKYIYIYIYIQELDYRTSLFMPNQIK